MFFKFGNKMLGLKSLLYFLSLTLGSQKFIIGAVSAPPQVQTTTAAAPAVTGGSSVPYTVNIDSPSYRRLKLAVPSPVVLDAKNLELQKISAKLSQEIHFLVEFTGLFEIIAPLTGLDVPQVTNHDKTILYTPDEVAKWKKIQMESVILISLTADKQSYRSEIRVFDVNQNQVILAKAYTILNLNQTYEIAQRFVDHLLQRYTGRPGIYNSKIVFVGKERKESERQIYTCDIDGKNLQKLTKENVIHMSPSWSPDGKKILYTSFEKKRPDLYMLELATMKKKVISAYPGINSGGVFTPNGKVIVYTGSVHGRSDLFMIREGEKERKPLITSPGLDVEPSFSPDEKYLAYVSGRWGNPHIVLGTIIWNSDKTSMMIKDEKRLTYAGWYNSNEEFSPDSSKIAFAGFDKELDRFDLFVMDLEGQMSRLTFQSGDNVSPTWSPNGQLIMFDSNRIGSSNNREKSSQLYIMDKEGRFQRQIQTGLYEAKSPKWSRYGVRWE